MLRRPSDVVTCARARACFVFLRVAVAESFFLLRSCFYQERGRKASSSSNASSGAGDAIVATIKSSGEAGAGAKKKCRCHQSRGEAPLKEKKLSRARFKNGQDATATVQLKPVTHKEKNSSQRCRGGESSAGPLKERGWRAKIARGGGFWRRRRHLPPRSTRTHTACRRQLKAPKPPTIGVFFFSAATKRREKKRERDLDAHTQRPTAHRGRKKKGGV